MPVVKSQPSFLCHMPRSSERRTWRNVLRFAPQPLSQATVRRYYDHYRAEAGLPMRCDNPNCSFHSAALVWNDKLLPLILDHVDGVRADNRPRKLRYLCPKCDAQLPTRGGRNKGRVSVNTGGYVVRRGDGKKDYTLVPEPGSFGLAGGEPALTVVRKKGPRKRGRSAEKGSPRKRGRGGDKGTGVVIAIMHNHANSPGNALAATPNCSDPAYDAAGNLTTLPKPSGE